MHEVNTLHISIYGQWLALELTYHIAWLDRLALGTHTCDCMPSVTGLQSKLQTRSIQDWEAWAGE